MDISLVKSVLNEALAFYPKPEIFNTDQGVNILPEPMLKFSKNITSKFLWMELVELQIIFVSKDSGEV